MPALDAQICYLLLIGDWHTAKFYEVIDDELYLGHWKDAVHTNCWLDHPVDRLFCPVLF